MQPKQSLRQKIQQLLQDSDFPGLVQLAAREKGVVDLLLQHLYDPHDLLHWRALEGLGHVAHAHPAQVQKIITRLLWLLNEDSGSFGWGAAAALGEIGRHELALVADIIPLFCGFLAEPFSRAPMLWGLGRLAEVHPDSLEEVRPFLRPILRDPDSQVRALGAWVMGKLREASARPELEALLGDPSPVEIYEGGQLKQTTVSQVAREALEAIS